MQLTLKNIKQETPDALSFIFEPETEISWTSGQFMFYILDHPNPDERGTKHYFTIASAPFEKDLMLTTRFAQNQSSTFKDALHNLKVGDKIEARGPNGQFIIEDSNKEYIFIAGGIGITPFRSILLDLDHNNLPLNINLLYANRTPDFIFKEELESLQEKHPNFKINYFVDPQRIDEEAIKSLFPNLKQPIFYVSGPEPMVESFEKMLSQIGVPDENIKRDFFPGYTWP